MSTTRIDLSALPFPNVLETLDYEAELAACKAELISRDPDLAPVLNYESEPLVKLLQTFAYRKFLKTGQINEKAKALMLAYAKGADLILNKKGTTWKKLSEQQQQAALASEAGLIDALAAHSSLIKRPVLSQNGRFYAGFQAAIYESVFKK